MQYSLYYIPNISDSLKRAGSVVDQPREISNGLKSSSHNERPHPPRFSTSCLPEMGSKQEHKHDDENDAWGLYRLVLMKCREGFTAHRRRIEWSSVGIFRMSPCKEKSLKKCLVSELEYANLRCILCLCPYPGYIKGLVERLRRRVDSKPPNRMGTHKGIQ